MLISLSFALIEKLQNYKDIEVFFLQILIKESKNHNLLLQEIIQNKQEFQVILEGDEENISTFAQDLSRHIPLSLQWAFKDFVIVEKCNQSTPFLQNKSLELLTPFELDSLCDAKNKDFCNLWGNFTSFVQTKLTLLKENEKNQITNANELKNALIFLANELKNKKNIFIKTIFGKKELILFDENNPINKKEELLFMPFDLNSTQGIFKTKQEELQALATLEKPIITFRPKTIFEDLFPLREIPCILPFEPILLLLSKFLNGFSGCYLFPLNDEKIANGLCYFIPNDSHPIHITVAKNSLIIPKRFQEKENFALMEFQNTIQDENLEKVNALYIGENKTEFLLYFNKSFKEAISFSFETNLGIFIDYLKETNKTTRSLLKNFTEKNEKLIKYLESLPKQSKLSNNLLDLLGLCGIFLDFSNDIYESRKKLLQEAKNFMGEKGPRIDFKLQKNENNELFLHTFQTLRSVMSFKLAGVEKDLLCFGILDSLAEFLANLSRDMEENYTTKGLIISGVLTLNKQFLDQLIHYLPKRSEVYVTKHCDVPLR